MENDDPAEKQEKRFRKRLKIAAWTFLLFGMYYLFLSGAKVSHTRQADFEALNIANMFAGVALLHFRKFWRLYAMTVASVFLFLKLLALPMTVFFLLKAGPYASLTWIGGADAFSSGMFAVSLAMSFASIVMFGWTLLILLAPEGKDLFELYGAEPDPFTRNEILALSGAVMLAFGSGFLVEKTGLLRSSPADAETDILTERVSNRQFLLRPDSTFRLPRTPNAEYSGLVGPLTADNGVRTWIALSFRISPDAKTVTIRKHVLSPRDLQQQETTVTLPAERPVLLTHTGDLLTGSDGNNAAPTSVTCAFRTFGFTCDE